MHFGVTPREIFQEWTYWQFDAYMQAAEELLSKQEGGGDRTTRTADGRSVQDGSNASADQLRAMGIPIMERR
jgi:hypothetical protein